MSQVDVHSDTWRAITDWAEPRLREAREKLEIPDQDDVTSHTLRGRIDELKKLLDLAAPQKPAVQQAMERPYG